MVIPILELKSIFPRIRKNNIFGDQHSPEIIMPCLLVVTEDFQFYYLKPTSILKIEDSGEVCTVTFLNSEEEEVEIEGMIQYLEEH